MTSKNEASKDNKDNEDNKEASKNEASKGNGDVKDMPALTSALIHIIPSTTSLIKEYDSDTSPPPC